MKKTETSMPTTKNLKERGIMMSDELIKSVMENYPEASFGSPLKCKEYNYVEVRFKFVDEETGENYNIDINMLRKGLKILLKIVKEGGYFNCGYPPALLSKEYDWDGQDVDALVQCAIFGEIMYG